MARGSSDVGVARRSRTHGGGPAHPSHWLPPALPSRPAAQLRAPRGPGAPAPPARAPDPAPGAVPWGLLPGGWHDSTCRKVRNRCFWNTGQCHLSVETPEQRGCLGPLGGLKGHWGHLRPAPPRAPSPRCPDSSVTRRPLPPMTRTQLRPAWPGPDVGSPPRPPEQDVGSTPPSPRPPGPGYEQPPGALGHSAGPV